MRRRRLPSRRGKRDNRHAKRGSHRTGISKNRSQRVLASLASLRSALQFVVVVVFLSVIFVGYRVYIHRIWKGSDRLTFVFQELEPASSSGMYVVSYLSFDETLVVVSFPAGMKIEAIGRYGPWRVESLYKLGELENKGGELVMRSLAEFFGANVDGWMVIGSIGSEIEDDNIRSALKQSIGKTLFGRGETNLGVWDLVRLWKAISTVRLNNIEWVDLSYSGVISEQVQPDGSLIFTADYELLDRLSRNLFSQPAIVEEGLSIAVLNATKHSGLGARVVRKIKNMGGDVVAVSDSERKYETTRVLVSEKLKESPTVSFLAKTFLIDEIQIGETTQQRADILIVVGEDYWIRLAKL